MLGTKHRPGGEPGEPPDLDSFGESLRFPEISQLPMREALLFRGARKWYLGLSFALTWLAFFAYEYFQTTSSVPLRVMAIALIVIYAAAVGVAVPLAWWLPPGKRIWVIIATWAASFMLWPIVGWHVSQTWTFVGVVIAMSMFSMRKTAALVGVLSALTVVFQYAGGVRGESLFYVAAIVASISMMMAGFARQIAAINQLRATQHELARLAVEKERGRVARDIHDILGHSLTAITVKAELAGMLIDADEGTKAGAEIAAVEELARGALADVRATVAGYRGVNIVGELANARSILASAGIDADLPTTVDSLPTRYRELAGWVVREGVTNVVRHSEAKHCRIRISPAEIEVADDGRGPAALTASTSTGLRGLGERVEAVGGSLRIGRSELGGFSLYVGMPPAHQADAA
ncbi:sensor histidine kinase [Rathayibacter soli]|uniref:sensor histidine kinase n=1 Tax=Rathayibacter soli TaxID=3144168 RepID=UPI0027E4B1D5|nr:sensor histidine kinase [Glaciibacter superstes]